MFHDSSWRGIMIPLGDHDGTIPLGDHDGTAVTAVQRAHISAGNDDHIDHGDHGGHCGPCCGSGRFADAGRPCAGPQVAAGPPDCQPRWPVGPASVGWRRPPLASRAVVAGPASRSSAAGPSVGRRLLACDPPPLARRNARQCPPHPQVCRRRPARVEAELSADSLMLQEPDACASLCSLQQSTTMPFTSDRELRTTVSE